MHETADARSFVLDVPEELRERFAYRAGQFVTVRMPSEGSAKLRCYSMSSAPEVDEDLVITVKRVPGGVVSNWMVDHVGPGDPLQVTAPAGTFRLDGDGDLVAFAAGSGITPIMSILRAALAGTGRSVRLLYANRDRGATIFAEELDRLERSSGGRLRVQHHHDVDGGFLDAAQVRAFAGEFGPSEDVYLCGPTPFMDLVESTLLAAGVDPARLHLERFATPTPDGPDEPDGDGEADVADEPAANDADEATSITIEIDGRSGTTTHRDGTTVLQTARQLGLDPPFSCESGSCATCMARLVEGTVSMHVNDALTDAEVDEGWVLTCQSVPTSTTVHVVYGFD